MWFPCIYANRSPPEISLEIGFNQLATVVATMSARRPERPSRKRKTHSSKTPWLIGILVAIAITVILASSVLSGNNPTKNRVLLKTTLGDIKIELYDDMPITTGNFKRLVQQGLYDDTIFHRVIAEFMIQGGNITGIPSIQDEFTENNRNTRGTIAMANAGPDTGSSQFFINLVDNSALRPFLDDSHPVFGRVIEGMDVVDSIGDVETDADDKPLQDIRIIRAELVE
jgi:peptidylprolyl isomerase